MLLGKLNIDFIDNTCYLPDGVLISKPTQNGEKTTYYTKKTGSKQPKMT
jgi:hypothetical protein